MTRFVIFPHLTVHASQRPNPYIDDYVRAVESLPGARVVNPAHKNPLLSLLFPSREADVYIFNWFESIPDFKYGLLQSAVATVFLLYLCLRKKKIVWMLHNKRPHARGRDWAKHFLARLIANRSSLIVTHSEEGVRLVADEYPQALKKTHFLHHPTKCRIPPAETVPEEKAYDLLIWGTIARYKGVFRFVEYLRAHTDVGLRVCIVGGASEAVYADLERLLPPRVTLVRRRPSFEELGVFIARSAFVLCPYNAESVLSSGMLMDSLSYGAKVIGPDTGSFRDYARLPQLCVYTFRSFDDIPAIVARHSADRANRESYRQFLTANDWPHFAQALYSLLQSTK